MWFGVLLLASRGGLPVFLVVLVAVVIPRLAARLALSLGLLGAASAPAVAPCVRLRLDHHRGGRSEAWH